jgi:hypothetical protein
VQEARKVVGLSSVRFPRGAEVMIRERRNPDLAAGSPQFARLARQGRGNLLLPCERLQKTANLSLAVVQTVVQRPSRMLLPFN